jgi:hypothetical protein
MEEPTQQWRKQCRWAELRKGIWHQKDYFQAGELLIAGNK